MNLIEVEAVIESTPFKDYIRTLFQDVLAERNSANWEFNVAKGTRNGYFGAWILDIYYNGEAVGVSSVFRDTNPTGWYVRQNIKRSIKRAEKLVGPSIRKELESV